MPGILTFNAADVAAIVAATKKASNFKLTWDERFDPDMHIDGIITYKDGWPDLKSIDPLKLVPKLWLVKDLGIFLVGNQVIPKGKTAVLCFAKGHSLDDDAHREKSSVILGPEDCVIPLPLIDFEIPLADRAKQIKIKVTQRNVRVYGV